MRNKSKILMVMFTLILTILAGCGNSSDKLSSKTDNQPTDNNLTESTDEDSSNQDVTDLEKDTTENSSEGDDNTELNDQEDASDHTSTKPDDGELLKTSKITESTKEEYLKKLNEMEESDRNSEAGTTTIELEEQEMERYKKWDVELNKIYGLLKEQLSTERMDKLREDQRNWIKHRDEVAKEASLKYQGGSMESLEYVATQASLTRERCYALVAKYMK
ncbi:lysozyme inhibitor LprI family protein [Psychrobacillus sp. OK032]|uniref:lysozyme inhibitor LprI family protein n=1 Tax=Psychrobacillus sp. OK032 TaxID=1884358 RepID=UPI0008CBAC2C|nr:lysozyme inhibitor LprI family protein [Psychrobacillus sp. OK032]SES35667.1 Uncharacterized conserved protein YecT, DUF1311 family [Psychrobacillus sp. OK032]